MAERLPVPGETIIGRQFLMVSGGKGANQAVAAARLGADVTLIARVGNDVFGQNALTGFRTEGISTEWITQDASTPSGVALILVDSTGENVIVVAPGANAQLSPEHVRQAQAAIQTASVLLLQLEVPVDTVLEAARTAHASGVRVILNPAPAQALPEELVRLADVITPNQTEAAILAGAQGEAKPPEALAQRLLAMGAGAVAMTLGAEGALLVTKEGAERVASPKVKAVDATAAGDAFNGALAVGLAEGLTLKEAAAFAVKAAAISVTRAGAQPSLPTRTEVLAFAG